MSKIKSKKQFKEQVDAAFETMKTRDEAKACYDFSRDDSVFISRFIFRPFLSHTRLP